jgi:hypothetical protein
MAGPLERTVIEYLMGLKTICKIRIKCKVAESLDMYKSAGCIKETQVSTQVGGFSRCGRINVRADVDGLFAWLSDMHRVGMASRAGHLPRKGVPHGGEYSFGGCEMAQPEQSGVVSR